VCNCVADDKVSVDLEIYVNRSTAPGLNSGEDHLDDILVLHLQGGKDLFVSVLLSIAEGDEKINVLMDRKLSYCKQIVHQWHGKVRTTTIKASLC